MSFSWQSQSIYLASMSARRVSLLEQIGVAFRQLRIDVDESLIRGESANDYVMRLAIQKAQAGWGCTERVDRLPVIGADTCVVIDDKILGKPRNKADAHLMLEQLSGRMHHVLTAVAIKLGSSEHVIVSNSDVWFREMSADEIELYWQTGEPADKAGAYGIQAVGGAFIEKIKGSYSGIMGLPLLETIDLITRITK